MKRLIILFLVICNSINGQNNSKSDIINSENAAYPLDYLTSAVTKLVQAEGHELNRINSDGVIYSIGSASTGVPSNAPSGFVVSRNIAFAKAVLRAKIEMLKISGESVTTQKKFSLVNNLKNSEDPDAIQKATIIDKLQLLESKSIDNALIQAGVSELEVEKLNQPQKQKVFEEKYYNYVASLVSSMIKGISIFKIVEGEVGHNDYQVAVCIKFSIANENLAANYKSLGATDETLKSGLITRLIEIESNKLIPKLGAQIIEDSFGNRYIIGFGQSSIQQVNARQSAFENMGYQKARLNAIDNIKTLLSEDLIGKQSEEDIEKIVQFKGGEQSFYTENNFNEMIDSKKSSLVLNTLELRRWKSNHPMNKEVVYGSIVVLLKNGVTPNIEMKPTVKGKFIESEDIK